MNSRHQTKHTAEALRVNTTTAPSLSRQKKPVLLRNLTSPLVVHSRSKLPFLRRLCGDFFRYIYSYMYIIQRSIYFN